MVCGNKIPVNLEDNVIDLNMDLKTTLKGGISKVELNNGETYDFIYNSRFYSRTPHFLREDGRSYVLLSDYNDKLKMKNGDTQLQVIKIF